MHPQPSRPAVSERVPVNVGTPPCRVVAIYGPTASGKSAVARALLDRIDGEVVSADSAALYAGLPILTAAPGYPARLVGVVPVTDDVSVGEYQRLAHAAVDEILAAARTPIVVGGTGLYLRAALSSLTIPPPPAPGERARWAAIYDAGPDEAYDLLARRDPDAAARVHPNDRRRVIRALELAEAGASLAPPVDQLWTDDMRHPTTLVGLELDPDELDRRIEARVVSQVEQGVVAEARSAWAQPLSRTARKVLGLEAFATLPVDEAVDAVVAASRRLARYQRKWLRRLPVAATLDAARPPEELADEIRALAGAAERLPGR
jgi:tRNA dimethylallyltransferase